MCRVQQCLDIISVVLFSSCHPWNSGLHRLCISNRIYLISDNRLQIVQVAVEAVVSFYIV